MSGTTTLKLPRPLGLPDFPWDTLKAPRALAQAHPEGMIDLSVGTPVDATPENIQHGLAAQSDSPGYPLVIGTEQIRLATHRWMRRRNMVAVPDGGVVPTTGSKEMVAWLPKILGVGSADKILYPEIAYPTYHVGAILAGAQPVAIDPRAVDEWPEDATLVWLNSPSNPTGEVLSADELSEIVVWARSRGITVVADECYAELPWSENLVEKGVPSLLNDQICQGDPSGLLVVYSLSKQSNMAGYRGGLVVGDPALVRAIIEARKHGGMMVPTPVQAAMTIALEDEIHVERQRKIYGRRRQGLLQAVTNCGFVSDSANEAGLYLWVKAAEQMKVAVPEGGQSGRHLVDWFAGLGILVAPGEFYGQKSGEFVRIALTASDADIDRACRRLERALVTS